MGALAQVGCRSFSGCIAAAAHGYHVLLLPPPLLLLHLILLSYLPWSCLPWVALGTRSHGCATQYCISLYLKCQHLQRSWNVRHQNGIWFLLCGATSMFVQICTTYAPFRVVDLVCAAVSHPRICPSLSATVIVTWWGVTVGCCQVKTVLDFIDGSTGSMSFASWAFGDSTLQWPTMAYTATKASWPSSGKTVQLVPGHSILLPAPGFVTTCAFNRNAEIMWNLCNFCLL